MNEMCSRNGSGGSYPPRRYGWYRSGCYPRIYGGGGPQEFRLTHEMGADIQALVCSVRSLIADIRVSLGLEIETGDKFSKPVVVNSSAGEKPVHGVDLDLPVKET